MLDDADFFVTKNCPTGSSTGATRWQKSAKTLRVTMAHRPLLSSAPSRASARCWTLGGNSITNKTIEDRAVASHYRRHA